MSQVNHLNHLINELSVADQILKTVDKLQKPDPIVEKVVQLSYDLLQQVYIYLQSNYSKLTYILV